MRHGQTPSNARHVWVGRQDEHLSEQGRSTLREAADRLAYVTIDYIYSSPMRRALATAHAVAEKQRVPPTLHLRVGLQERDFGRFQGLEKTLQNREQLDSDPSVETLASMQQRLAPVLREMATLQGNVLVVSHSAVYRCIVQTMHYTATPAKAALANAEWVTLYSPSS